MSQQRQRVITTEQAAALFRTANIPEPPTETLRFCAVTMTNIARHYPPKVSVERTPQDRAQAAVDELRRVLPGIIEEEIGELSKWPKFQKLQERHSESMSEDIVLGRTFAQLLAEQSTQRNAALAAHQLLLKSLCDFDLPRPSARYAQIWHEDAEILLDMYRSVVGARVGISKSGPTVRFILAALKICGAPANITGSAVARALAPPKRMP